jgi:hypothetical protein
MGTISGQYARGTVSVTPIGAMRGIPITIGTVVGSPSAFTTGAARRGTVEIAAG